MGNKWSTTTISGYKANNPSDDGAVTAANQVKYSSITTNLTDPLNSSLTTVIAKLDELFTITTKAKSSAYTTVASDHTIALQVTGTTTITLLAAASAGAGYWVRIKNAGTALVAVARDASDTIDGATSYLLGPGSSATFVVNSAGDGYIVIGGNGSLVLLNKTAASGVAAVTWDNTIITSAFDVYLITFSNVVPSTTLTLYQQVSNNNGSSFTSTGYDHFREVGNSGSAAQSYDVDSNESGNVVISGATTAYILNGESRFYNFSSYPTFRTQLNWTGSIGNFGMGENGASVNLASVNAIRFVTSTGTISGNFAIYGLRKS